jgi:hypothetical protein
MDCLNCSGTMDLDNPLTNLTICNLYRVNNIIYSKSVLDTLEPLFTFTNPYFTSSIVYCYNYKNLDYTHCVCKFGLYFCCNKPLLLMCIAPFTMEQYKLLIENIGVQLST